MALDTDKYKALLESELEELIKDLKSVGYKNPDNPDDWAPKPDVMDVSQET